MIIKLEQFEGPMNLLLKVIEQEKLSITEINLAKVADQYVEYIKSSADITADNIADFLVVASKLLLIKSKSLLPYLSQEDEEEIEEFQEQLKMYQDFLLATKHVSKLAGKINFMFAREFDRKALLSSNQMFFPPVKLDIEQMLMAMDEVAGRLEVPEELEESVIEEEISLDDRIDYIGKFVTRKFKVVFSHLIKEAKTKTDVIVNFLAILELMKQRDIDIDQQELFGEIEINKI